MCEVAVAPATRFSPGVALSTVVDAIKSRRGTERYTFNAKMDRITTPPTPSAPAHTCDFADGLERDCPACHPSAPAVDDAMVERAWMAYTGRDKLGSVYADDAMCMTREERRDMQAALTAALSGVSAPVGVEAFAGYTLAPTANLLRLAETLELIGGHPQTAAELRAMVAVSSELIAAALTQEKA